jgi:hypothetical protein
MCWLQPEARSQAKPSQKKLGKAGPHLQGPCLTMLDLDDDKYSPFKERGWDSIGVFTFFLSHFVLLPFTPFPKTLQP